MLILPEKAENPHVMVVGMCMSFSTKVNKTTHNTQLNQFIGDCRAVMEVSISSLRKNLRNFLFWNFLVLVNKKAESIKKFCEISVKLNIEKDIKKYQNKWSTLASVDLYQSINQSYFGHTHDDSWFIWLQWQKYKSRNCVREPLKNSIYDRFLSVYVVLCWVNYFNIKKCCGETHWASRNLEEKKYGNFFLFFLYSRKFFVYVIFFCGCQSALIVGSCEKNFVEL